MYKYILFDLDGTLTDSKDGIVNCVRYALEKMNAPVPGEDTLLRFIGPPLQESFPEFCGFGPEETREAIRLFRERYQPVGQYENRATPGIVDLLSRLRNQGRELALASSKSEPMCGEICRRFGFAPYLSHIVGSPIGGDWSKADVIREAIRRLGSVSPKDILMVGDRKFDVLGAKAHGINCLGVNFFGYAAPGEMESAGAVSLVSTVEALGAYILTH